MENKRVILEVKGLEVYCKVVDSKTSFGVARVLITPEAGNGQTWVNVANVKEVNTNN